MPHVYEVRPRQDHRGFDLISDVLPFGRLWYGEPNAISNAIVNAMHSNRSAHGVLRESGEPQQGGGDQHHHGCGAVDAESGALAPAAAQHDEHVADRDDRLDREH